QQPPDRPTAQAASVRDRRRVPILAAAAVLLAAVLALAPASPAAGASAAPPAPASATRTAAGGAVAGTPGPPALGVRGAILVAQNTSQRLYGVNPNAELPSASGTKLMTALVTLEVVPTTE